MPAMCCKGLMQVLADNKPFLGELYGRLKGAGEGDCPVFAQCEGKSAHTAGNSRRQVARA